MSVDIINVSLNHIKQIPIDVFNNVNKTQVSPPLTDLDFQSTGEDGTVLLNNPTCKGGVVINKIALDQLFSKEVDLRPFIKGSNRKTSELFANQVDDFNTKHSTEVVMVEANILNAPTVFDVELVKNFVLFCRVFGFYELGIGDVNLNQNDGKMIISVPSTHKLFTGYIEVLV